jgi:hypothetical protein
LKKERDKLIHIWLIITLIFFSTGCEKVINIDLNEATPVIVIEGLITDRAGPYTIILSKTGSYFNQPVLPPVTGAEVIISDDSGITDILKEIRPGVYLTSVLKGVPGRTYTLKVSAENKEYTASSTMHSHVLIDSLSLDKGDGHYFNFGGGPKEEVPVELNCWFRDPAEKNFYRLKVYTNDTARTENYRLYDDQYTNGEVISLRAAHAKAGAAYRIELFSLDRQTFGYYRTLEDLFYTNPFFGSAPANPVSNLSNGALGYFGASAVSNTVVTITPAMIQGLR